MIPGLELVGVGVDVEPQAPVRVTETIVGASHVHVDVEPDDGVVAGFLRGASGAITESDGRRWAFAGVRTSARRIRLTWEDATVARLRAHVPALAVPAGSVTLTDLVQRLAADAGVPVRVEPLLERIPAALPRQGAWSLVRGLAEHAFVDATGVWVVGSDAWLRRGTVPVDAVAEDGQVRDVDVLLDTGRPESVATLLVDVEWEPRPGDTVRLPEVDTAGAWLITHRVTDVDSETATITATRGPLTLAGEVPWP